MENKGSAPIVIRLKYLLNYLLNKPALCVAVLVALIAFGWFFYPIQWVKEIIEFDTGYRCYVFREPKLFIFLGDGGDEKIIDHSIYTNGTNVNLYFGMFSGYSQGSLSLGENGKGKNIEFYSFVSMFGRMTMKFLDGKHVMVVSSRGTKLTLSDGRQFTLDGKTPLLLRCKSDGTVIKLNELPEGLAEYLESPYEMIEFLPGMFRKAE